MLRNNFSEPAATAYQPAPGFVEKRDKRPLVGRSIYSRRGDLVGYAVGLDNLLPQTPEEGLGGGFVATRAESYIAHLNRIVRACSRSALSSQTGGEVRGISIESMIVMQIQPQVLLVERFSGALVRATEAVRKQGFKLCMAFEATDLAFIRDVREFRQVLYQLGDHGVDLVMRDPMLSDYESANAPVIERAVSTVSITPEWLGIGTSEKSFNHSVYFEQVTRLNSVIHEEGKTVILEGVANEWQESFVSSLPISYFSLRKSDDDVYV